MIGRHDPATIPPGPGPATTTDRPHPSTGRAAGYDASVIVVVGQPVLRFVAGEPVAAGPAARIAIAAAARGSTVQLIGKVGEDPDGDALVLALARSGVGHVALLRDPSRPTPRMVEPEADAPLDEAPGAEPGQITVEPADPERRPTLDAGDVDLGLRYLTEFTVLVVTETRDGAQTDVMTAAAGWTGATIIVLVQDGLDAPLRLPDEAIVLQAPPPDPDGPFDILVGDLAAAIDRGIPPQIAFREIVAAEGWEPASP